MPDLLARIHSVSEDPARNADHGRVGRNRIDHDRVGADAGVGADCDISQHLGPRTHDNVIPECRMPFFALVARSPEGHALVNQAIVSDDRGLANDCAHAMVDEKSAPDRGPRMDLDPREDATQF